MIFNSLGYVSNLPSCIHIHWMNRLPVNDTNKKSIRTSPLICILMLFLVFSIPNMAFRDAVSTSKNYLVAIIKEVKHYGRHSWQDQCKFRIDILSSLFTSNQQAWLCVTPISHNNLFQLVVLDYKGSWFSETSNSFLDWLKQINPSTYLSWKKITLQRHFMTPLNMRGKIFRSESFHSTQIKFIKIYYMKVINT